MPANQASTEQVPAKPVPTNRHLGVRWLLALLAGSVTYVMTATTSASRSGNEPTLLGVQLATQPEPKALAEARAALLRDIRRPIVVRLGTKTQVMTREALGLRIDERRLVALVRESKNPESVLRASRAEGKSVPVSLPLVVDPRASLSALTTLKDDLDEPPQDAKIDLETRKVLPEVPGVLVDVYASLAKLDDALNLNHPTFELVSQTVVPNTTQTSLGKVEVDEVLGFFETKYATDKKHEDRTFNLRLAASKLSGKVVLPGQVFDFNVVVGPRDVPHGYKIAKVIADGELVDGIGGGTCQVAGTLHGAAVFSGLEVVQRTPHTRPSSYIKMGLDAAVAYPTVTLRLRNPFPFPVVLKETVTNGLVRAEVLGPKRTRTVTFVRKIDDLIPFGSREVKDDRLPKGARVVTQRGIPGFKVRRYRIVREGTTAVRERTMDSYPPTTEVVRIGTGVDPTAHRPDEDEHPEYVADEYLAITQGLGVGHKSVEAAKAGGGMEEVRTPGKTGIRGWTKKYARSKPVEARGAEDRDSDDDSPDDKPKKTPRNAKR